MQHKRNIKPTKKYEKIDFFSVKYIKKRHTRTHREIKIIYIDIIEC